MDDFNDLLAGIDAFDDVLADGFIFDPGDEILDDGKSDVGFEKRYADLAGNRHDVIFAERAFAAQLAEDVSEFVT